MCRRQLARPRPAVLIDRPATDGGVVPWQAAAPAPTPTAPSAVVPGQEGAGGLTTAMLAAAPPEQQKQVPLPPSHRTFPAGARPPKETASCEACPPILRSVWTMRLT